MNPLVGLIWFMIVEGGIIMNAKTENDHPKKFDEKQIIEGFKSKLLGPLRESLDRSITAEQDMSNSIIL